MIRVLLADDHTMVRKGLRAILEEANIEVVGEANNGHEVLKLLEKIQPHVIVMDISMPKLNGIRTTSRIKKQFPDIKVLILSRHDYPDYIFQSLQAGASGYLVKKSAPDELFIAIHAIYNNHSYLSPSISKLVVDDYYNRVKTSKQSGKSGILSNRESEVLQLLTEGNSTREIAEILFISMNTVATHRRNIMKKLGVHSISQLIRYVIEAEKIDVK